MAYTTIDDGSAHFTTTLYTGNESTNAITNSANAGDFQPDWVWLKSRNSATHHRLYDTSRGALKNLISSATNSEATTANSLTSFDSNGFTLGSDDNSNQNTKTFVAWQWKANGGTLTTNDASATSVGTHDSQYQANTTAGFSIVTWTGNAEQETLAHGLGATPEMIWIKNRSDTEGWWVGATPAGAMSDGKYLLLNQTAAVATNSTSFVNQNPTSTVFRVGGSNSTADNAINGNSDNMIAYCFTSIKGYSKIGSYIANGNADGPFIYMGFKPAFVIFKRTDGGTSAWQVHDRTRETINDGGSPALKPNATDTEFSKNVDFLSNGIKIRDTSSDLNGGSGQTYIYMAFAEHPFVSSKGVPVTAR